MSFKLTYKTHMISFIMQILISIFLYNLINSIIHELIHGLAYKIFGGKIKFGFKLNGFDVFDVFV